MTASVSVCLQSMRYILLYELRTAISVISIGTQMLSAAENNLVIFLPPCETVFVITGWGLPCVFTVACSCLPVPLKHFHWCIWNLWLSEKELCFAMSLFPALNSAFCCRYTGQRNQKTTLTDLFFFRLCTFPFFEYSALVVSSGLSTAWKWMDCWVFPRI